MSQFRGAGATRQPSSSGVASSHHRAPTAPRTTHTTQSAPARLPSMHLDGTTVYSFESPGPHRAYVATEGGFFGSQGGTATEYPRASLPVPVAAGPSQTQSQATNTWVRDNDSHPLTRCRTPPEQRGVVGMCDGCSAARIIKSLELDMAVDQVKTPPADDEKGHYFAGLPRSEFTQHHPSMP